MVTPTANHIKEYGYGALRGEAQLRQRADVERLTTDYINWYNHARLHGELGHVTAPEEYDQAYYAAPPAPPGESSPRKTA